MLGESNDLGVSVLGPSENLVSVEMPEGKAILVDQADIKTVLGKRLLSKDGKLYSINLRENGGNFYATEKK